MVLTARLSGARPLGGASLLPEVRPSWLAVWTRWLCGGSDAPVVTLLVHCVHPEPLRDELQRQLESALFALCCLLGEPAVAGYIYRGYAQI